MLNANRSYPLVLGLVASLAGCAVPLDGTATEGDDVESNAQGLLALRRLDDDDIGGGGGSGGGGGTGGGGGSDDRPTPTEFSSIEDVPIWRLELEVRTARRDNAATDDRVRARLRTRSGGTVDLDLGRDDREGGRIDRYTINPWSVRTVGDIQQLEVFKNGTDGWCVDRVVLRVNSDPVPLYARSFSPCHWIDGDDGHLPSLHLSSSTLRGYSGWSIEGRARMVEPPSVIPGSVVNAMVEGAVGDALGEYAHVAWGGLEGSQYVEVSRAGRHATAVDLDLAYDLGWHYNSYEFDGDFLISWRCTDGEIDPEVDGLDLDLDLGRQMEPPLEHRVHRHLEDMFLRLRHITRDRGYRCTEDPTVRSDGGIETQVRRNTRVPIFTRGLALATFHDAPPSIEDVPVWSIEVETETGTVDDANTDDPVYVQLTEHDDRFTLRNVEAPHRRGAVDRFYVTAPHIERISDIDRLHFALPVRREDGWCVQRVALYVNDHPVPLFERDFGSCVWVDTDRTDQTPLHLTREQLRSDPRWSMEGRSGIATPPSLLSPAYLKNIVENVVGDIGGPNGYFEDCPNRSCIEVDRASARAVSVAATYWHDLVWASDERFHTDFDLVFRCLDGRLDVEARFSGASPVQDLAGLLENLSIGHRCTKQPEVVDYGYVSLPLSE